MMVGWPALAQVAGRIPWWCNGWYRGSVSVSAGSRWRRVQMQGPRWGSKGHIECHTQHQAISGWGGGRFSAQGGWMGLVGAGRCFACSGGTGVLWDVSNGAWGSTAPLLPCAIPCMSPLLSTLEPGRLGGDLEPLCPFHLGRLTMGTLLSIVVSWYIEASDVRSIIEMASGVGHT